VDLRVTLVRGMDQAIPPTRSALRPWEEADLPPLYEIARVSHRDSRFYFDAGFPRGRCDDLYQIWVKNSCAGFADALLVAGESGRAAGYITCQIAPDGHGKIGLMAVGEEFRGRGLGQDLVSGALQWFASRGVPRVSVVTQGRNFAAQRTYQRCGFETGCIEIWYHRWFDIEALA
jgi:dTDP-4-amino-4,6-dideoxy-D-galactose acyltransferase